MKENKQLTAWLLLILIAAIWGTSFILMKKALGVYSVTEVAAGRIFLAFVFFIPLIWINRRAVPPAKYPFLITSGLLGYLLPAFLFSLAGTKLNSSLSGTLNSLSPLFTLIIGALFFGQSFKLGKVIGIGIGLCGALLLVFSSSSAGGLRFDNPYALLVVLATLMYGINVNVIVRNLSDLPALVSTSWTFVFVGPVAFVILCTTGFFGKFFDTSHWQTTLFLTSLGVLASGITSILFNRVIQLSSGVFAASVTYLIPIVAISWGLLDGEQVLVQHYVGIAVILGGIYLVNKTK